MEPFTKKELIIRLIQDDLVQNKLVDGLDGLGLEACEYSLNLSDTILKLFGFSDYDYRTEDVFEYYIERREQANQFNVKEPDRFLKLAEDIYLSLEAKAAALK